MNAPATIQMDLPALILTGISKYFDKLEVLRDISVQVGQGEIRPFLESSGCGKNTLLNILSGLLPAGKGTLHIAGVAAEQFDGWRRFAYMFQEDRLLPWRSVEANISLALEHHRLSRADKAARIDDALARTKLTDFRHALPKQLSGGMKQRVAIARALVVNPAVMLMDEPLSALDSQTRELLMDDLIGLWSRTPFTAVYITHNLAEAVRLGHQVVVLSRRPGRIREIVEIDTPLAERRAGDATLETPQARLWGLMRDEAAAADAELALA